MPVDSWMKPEEAALCAATAAAMIDAALVGSGLSRDGYWAAVRKGYNTPYNDPQSKDRSAGACTVAPDPIRIDPADAPLPVAAMAAHAAAVEIHAG